MGLLSKIPLIAIWKDFANYREWIHTIKREKRNPNSLFNKYNMQNNFFYNIYIGVTLPPEDQSLPDHIKRLRVVESLAPVHRYIDSDLGFADYIVPEFNQVFDDENISTLTYVVVYYFAFKKLSLKYIFTRILYLSIFFLIVFKFPWEKFFAWIGNLI